MNRAARIALRAYRPEDLETLYALDVLCFAPRFRFSKAAMKEFAEAANALVTIAEIDAALAGFGIVHIESIASDREAYLVTLDVVPTVRRKGVAGVLMQRLESDALVAGCSALLLHVYTGNDDAVRLYERLGYTLSHMAAGFYGRGFDALVYRKVLQG